MNKFLENLLTDYLIHATLHRHAILLCVCIQMLQSNVPFFSKIHSIFHFIFDISIYVSVSDNGQHTQGHIPGSGTSTKYPDTQMVACGQTKGAGIAQSVLPILTQHKCSSTGFQVQSYWGWIWNAADTWKVWITYFILWKFSKNRALFCNYTNQSICIV